MSGLIGTIPAHPPPHQIINGRRFSAGFDGTGSGKGLAYQIIPSRRPQAWLGVAGVLGKRAWRALGSWVLGLKV